MAAQRGLEAQACAPLTATTRAGAIYGVVRDDAGEPASSSQVTATWQEWRLAGFTLSELVRTREVATDGSGAFEFCALPPELTVAIVAKRGPRASRIFSVRPGGPPLALRLETTRTLLIDAQTAGRAIAPLRGFVRDSIGARLAGVRLSLPDGASAVSDEQGEFELFSRSAGNLPIEIRRLGYRPRTVRTEVPVRSGPLEIVLEPVPVQLSDVVTSADRTPFELFSGFSERRRRSPGTFIDRSELDRRRPQELTDVLRGVPGITVQTGLTRWGYQTTPSMGRASGGAIGCRIEYFVNGHEYTPTSMGIDTDISPDQIEAIEVYKASEVPAQFLGGRARCGVVVIWTRYRAHELER